jgi:hypothetical protein
VNFRLLTVANNASNTDDADVNDDDDDVGEMRNWHGAAALASM